MTNKSNQPSSAPVKAVDSSLVVVIRVLDRIASALNCAYFVAGATARDLILVNVHGLRPGRATRDIDFGIAVEDWNQFHDLKRLLIASGDFVADSKAQQRLSYTAGGLRIPVDLIPFRGVASAGETIAWPPSRDVVLNVAGFEEAWASSVPVEIAPGLIVRVASVPGLTLLKLIAWSDRGFQNNKDAADLHKLLTTYTDAGNLDRLYDQELDLLEAAAFDLDVAGAVLLGRDVARICSPSARQQLKSLLTSEAAIDRLAVQMIVTSSYEEASEALNRMLSGFCRGFLSD